MSKRYHEYKALRDQGMTYKEIAEIYGVSTQAVQASVTKCRDGFHKKATENVCYPGLRRWMIANRVGKSTLAELCGIERTTMYLNLTRKDSINKKTIDVILRVTGLTYEECFKEDDPE